MAEAAASELQARRAAIRPSLREDDLERELTQIDDLTAEAIARKKLIRRTLRQLRALEGSGVPTIATRAHRALAAARVPLRAAEILDLIEADAHGPLDRERSRQKRVVSVCVALRRSMLFTQFADRRWALRAQPKRAGA